jgi:hypothetical protein
VNADQLALDEYRAVLSAAARAQGEERSRWADRPGFDEARAIVLELVEDGQVITADDVRPHLELGDPSVLCAVFGALRREGLIEVDGYALSKVPSRHGALVRRWRAT